MIQTPMDRRISRTRNCQTFKIQKNQEYYKSYEKKKTEFNQERHRIDHRMIQKFEIWGRPSEKQKGKTKVALYLKLK